LYAITEIASAAHEAVHPKHIIIRETEKVKGFGFTLKEFKDNFANMLISALIGTGIGILPGIGGGTAGLLAYSVEKSRSKNPEKYGKGCMEGVVASETSNNAVIGGAMVPLLTLGIPGDGATAMLLGGLMIHSVTTGPLIFQKYGDTVYAIYGAMLIAAVMMLFVVLVLLIKVLPIFQEVFQLPQTGKVDYSTWYKISEIYVGVSRIAELT